MARLVAVYVVAVYVVTVYVVTVYVVAMYVVAVYVVAVYVVTRLATVRSGPDRGLFWRLLKRLDCTVQSFVGLDWTVPKDRTVRR